MNINIFLSTYSLDHVSNHSFSDNDQKFSTKLIQIQATQHRFYVTSSKYWIHFRLKDYLKHYLFILIMDKLVGLG